MGIQSSKYYYFLISLLFLFACGGTTGGGNAAPTPPAEIPLAGTMATVVDIPYVSDPITSTSNEEITGGSESIIGLKYFQEGNYQNNAYPITDIFSNADSTNEAACVYSWLYAKQHSFAAYNDRVLYIMKLIRDYWDNNDSEDLYDGNDHIMYFDGVGTLNKVKVNFDGSSTSGHITNITSMTLHVCLGANESALKFTHYFNFERTAFNGTIDQYELNSKYLGITDGAYDGTEFSMDITTFNDANLDLVEQKTVAFSYNNVLTTDNTSFEFGSSNFIIGKNNVSMSGFSDYTGLNYLGTATINRVWQLNGVGELFIDSYDNYNLLEDTRIGDAIVNYKLNQGSTEQICFTANNTQTGTCPNLFANADALGDPATYQSSIDITFDDEETWDCSGTGVTIDVVPYIMENAERDNIFFYIEETAETDCNDLF